MWITRTVPSRGALLAIAVSLVATSPATVGAQPSGSARTRRRRGGYHHDQPLRVSRGETERHGSGRAPLRRPEVFPYSADATLEQVVVRVGFWNSLNSGGAGAGGPADAPWYESRLSGGVGVRLSGDVMLSSSVTAYSSPNGMFYHETAPNSGSGSAGTIARGIGCR